MRPLAAVSWRAMANGNAALVIADIGGYTRFMKLHRVNLTHAQLTVAALLEAVIDQAGPLELVKLEGDAAFFWLKAPTGQAWSELASVFARMRSAFVGKRDTLISERMCSCESCEQIDRLRLKFVAHEGEVAEQRVKQFIELAGVDVILVHRMLKNDVPVNEYVLFTDAVRAQLPSALKSKAQGLEHDFEGLGKTQTWFVDAEHLEAVPAAPPAAAPRGWRRLWTKVKRELSGAPYLLGLKRPTEGFRNGPAPADPGAGTL